MIATQAYDKYLRFPTAEWVSQYAFISIPVVSELQKNNESGR